MTWHYLPVYTDSPGERWYSFCEVHLDEQGLVKAWTQNRAMAPSGSTVAELRTTLRHMLNDTERWEPVEFCQLAVGMRLQARAAARAAPWS